MTVVTFALPEESQDLIRALEHPRRLAPSGDVLGTLGGRELVVAHTGVGAASAAKRIQEILDQRRPSRILSAGYAGGLHPALVVGDLVFATNYCAPTWLESVGATKGANKGATKGAGTFLSPVSSSGGGSGGGGPSLPSAASQKIPPRPRTYLGTMTTQATVIESVADKARLAAQTEAVAVDMETAPVAEACAAAGVPLLSLRVISDCASDALPVPMPYWFDLSRQRPRPLGLVAYLARHPGQILPFARFVRGLGPARRALTVRLVEILALECV